MALPRGSQQPVYAPESEHKIRLRQALVRAVYSTTAGSTTRGPLTATVADPKAADARDTAAHGEGEEGEVHEYAEGEGEHGIEHADASGKVVVASGVPLDERIEKHLDEEQDEDLDFVPEPGAALHRPKPKPPLAVDSDAMVQVKDWLRKQRLTKAIAYFVESEVDLESMLELTEEQFEEWLSELPLDTLQKLRLRKGLAKLRVRQKTEAVEDSGECKESVAAAAAIGAPVVKSAVRLTVTHFFFDPFERDMASPVQFFEISADSKTATSTRATAGIVVCPFLKSPTTNCELRFYIAKLSHKQPIIGVYLRSALDVTEPDSERIVAFESRGCVLVGNHWITTHNGEPKQFSFGGWKKGDHVKISLDLRKCKASINTPYGVYETEYPRKEEALRFIFVFSQNTKISLF